MSVSLWRYSESCEGKPCCGDCDLCGEEKRMSDLISRQAAIDALCDNCDNPQAVCAHYPCDQYVSIEQLPSATQQWIPVSERLPKEDEYVLATTSWGSITMAERTNGYRCADWFIHEGNTNASNEDILAWMPLPEPYKGVE